MSECARRTQREAWRLCLTPRELRRREATVVWSSAEATDDIRGQETAESTVLESIYLLAG